MTETLPFDLPARVDDFDAAFMTTLLRYRGIIAETNEVVRTEEADVGMTAGYFSTLKKVKCFYKEQTDAEAHFVVKTWPSFEILPEDAIKAMFRKDIKGYTDFGADEFYPRPNAILAACDEERNRWALVMEDADAFAEHKVHETELDVEEVRILLPRLVDLAVQWEGCHEGPKADRLAALGVEHWASDANLALYKSVMPNGAPFQDKTAAMESWVTPTMHASVGPNLASEFTKRLGPFFAPAVPRNGATCTLSHGDLRGDNIFMAAQGPRCPHGWLVIDFQLMFTGPVPSDLAYLMNSGSVLPSVYSGEHLKAILREFYDAFMAKTQVYPSYTYQQFEREYVTMSTVLYVYFVGMGAAFAQAAAFNNETATRVELGGQGATEADLAPEELRQRMWWRKATANFRETFKTFGLYQYLQSLPCDDPPPDFIELPEHLK